MSKSFKMLLIGFLTAMILACAASPGGESAGEFLDSSSTTTKVKASLVDHLGTNGLSVQVKTYKDHVQLSGFIDTPRMKRRAGIIAAGVEGVKSVSNDIIVKPN